MRPSRPRPRLDRRPLPVERRQERRLRLRQRGRHRQRRVRRRLLPRRKTSASSRTPPTSITLYDRWFCSIMASTYPNRHYQWGAQNGGQKSNVFPLEVPARRRASPGRRSSTGPRRTGVTSPTTTPTCRSRRSTAQRGHRPDAAGLDLLRAGARRARCRTSASSTRRSATAAAATASPPTSIRTATSASARRSCRTSSTPSSSRRSTSAGRDVHQLRRVGRLLRPRPAAVRPRRPPQPGRPRQRLEPDRLPRPRRRGLALRPRRQRQPHDGHPRVDPEADLLQVRLRPPQHAPPLRLEHRPQLRLQQPRPRAARSSPMYELLEATPCSLQERRRRAGAAEAARHGRARDLRLPRLARLRGPRRDASTRSSATRTRSRRRSKRATARPRSASDPSRAWRPWRGSSQRSRRRVLGAPPRA